MREKLNSNPVAQVALVAVLLIGVAFMLMSMGKGGEEEEAAPATTEATVTVAGSGETGTATAATPGEAVEGAIETATATTSTTPASVPAMPPGSTAPPLPREVIDAFEANRTVVLLFVRNGGIDDEIVKGAVERLGSLGDVSTFVVPADRIARYASITQGVAVDRVPALVVVTPKKVDDGIPTASVTYGFQSPASVVQAVVDAGYEGRTLDYHP